MTTQLTAWASKDGEFRRQQSSFRNFISPNSTFVPEVGRYHLYVSFACPWATRALIMRNLKGLNQIISVSVVHWHLKEGGWFFPDDANERPGATVDHVNGFKRVAELYLKANPAYSARYTVPVLWDKKLQTIVSNESADIIRIFNSAFNSLLPTEFASRDYYPKVLQEQIDEFNQWIYDDINNGVYKSGFATTQDAYEKHVVKVFEGLNRIEEHLGKSKSGFIFDQLTETDIRLWVTIIRFDCTYVQHFKCNIAMIRHNYPNINNWMKELYWNYPEFKESTNFEHIKLVSEILHSIIQRVTPKLIPLQLPRSARYQI
jgi:putative glutathione S-transferase